MKVIFHYKYLGQTKEAGLLIFGSVTGPGIRKAQILLLLLLTLLQYTPSPEIRRAQILLLLLTLLQYTPSPGIRKAQILLLLLTLLQYITLTRDKKGSDSPPPPPHSTTVHPLTRD